MKHFLYFSLLFLISCTQPSFEKDGGIRIVLEASSADNKQMEQIKLILAQRLDAFGIENSTIRLGDQPELIVLEIPGKVNLQRIRGVLQSSAKLEFWETYDNAEMNEKITKLNTAISEELYPELKDTTKEEKVVSLEGLSLEEQLAAQKSEKEIEEEKMQNVQKRNPVYAVLSPAYRYDVRQQPIGFLEGPVVGMALLQDTAKVNHYFNSPQAKSIFGSGVKFLWTYKPVDKNSKVHQLVAIRIGRTGKAALWEDIVKKATVIFNDNEGAPEISLVMNQLAGFDFEKMTKRNIGKAIAIVVDDMVYSYPIVHSEIPGGKVSIAGNFTKDEAMDFASILNAGYLPVSLRIVEEEEVAPKK